MRKLFLVLCLCSLAATWLAGQSIVVTSPAAGATWCLGSAVTINWSAPEVSGPIAIKLRRAGAPDAPPVMDIATGLANSGSFTWTVPASLPPGSYLVRVRTVSDTPLAYGDSGDFVIAACGAQSRPGIGVISPKAGDTFFINGKCLIAWKWGGALSDRVRIDLLKDGAPFRNITPKAKTANGEFDWSIPEGSIPAGTYAVRVSTVDDAVSDDSPPFAISFLYVAPLAIVSTPASNPAGPRLTVLTPNGGENLRRGSECVISWRLDGPVNAPFILSRLEIWLINMDGSNAGSLGNIGVNLGTHQTVWMPVGTVAAHGHIQVRSGSYKIKIFFDYGSPTGEPPRRNIEDTSDTVFNIVD